ncbi:SIR2 family protein [Psychrobacillus sp. MER TA 17]|nr:SIR2 family protein [Psychrobacillus sp. MER TA 17]
MNIKQIFSGIQESKRLPIMFVGSGISKRYTTNDFNWEQLLVRCIQEYDKSPINKYKWYKQKIISDKNLDPKSYALYENIGGLIERDFNLAFFENKINTFEYNGDVSPLKVFISNILKEYSIKGEMSHELQALKELSDKMLTVITTNYDTFLEDEIFNNHDTLVKQQMFTGSELGTIFKLHGCVTDPSSIILTKNDYSHFKKKSKVLSAKVISLFAENPVIFLGYSVTDENVRNFLSDIYSCLENESEYMSFEKRLIIVDFQSDQEEPVVGTHSIMFKETRINMTKVVLSDFGIIYDQLKLLRDIVELKEVQRLKNIVSEIVHDYSGEQKRVFNLTGSVKNENDEESFSGDEVVVVITKRGEFLSSFGITGLTANDVYRDLIYDSLDSKLAMELQYFIEKQLPVILRSNASVPVNKYISRVDASNLILDERVQKMINREPNDLLTNAIRKDKKEFEASSYESFEQILSEDISKTKKIHYLVLYSIICDDPFEIKEFLLENEGVFGQWSNGETMKKKMICIFDIRVYKNSAA